MDSRDGFLNFAPMSASLRLDVFEARSASGFAAASSFANRSRLACRFSKIASMTTSARRAPSPGTSGVNKSSASRILDFSRSRRLKSSAARFIAGARRSGDWSCSVTVRPRIAHQAAMSPPMTPAPTT